MCVDGHLLPLPLLCVIVMEGPLFTAALIRVAGDVPGLRRDVVTDRSTGHARRPLAVQLMCGQRPPPVPAGPPHYTGH